MTSQVEHFHDPCFGLNNSFSGWVEEADPKAGVDFLVGASDSVVLEDPNENSDLLTFAEPKLNNPGLDLLTSEMKQKIKLIISFCL